MKRVKFTTNIDEELLKKVKIVAVEKGLNVNDIIEEQLNKYLKEEKEMKKVIIETLKNLDKEDLLNKVGENLARNPEQFTETFEMMIDYFEGYTEEMIAEKLSTSSLVGADENLAIREWVAEEEVSNLEIEDKIKGGM